MTDRELMIRWAALDLELRDIKDSKAQANIARKAEIKDALRIVEREWSEIVARKRRGEITDHHGIDLVKRIAEPHLKLSGLPIVMQSVERTPTDSSHITRTYVMVAMILTGEPIKDDDDDALGEMNDDEFEDYLDTLPEDDPAKVAEEARERETATRQLAKLAIGITTEIREADPHVLLALKDASHFNEALEATRFFTVKPLDFQSQGISYSGVGIHWLIDMLPWNGYGIDQIRDD